MGAVTHPVALRVVEGEGGRRLKVVNPRRELYSRSGNHGTWIYRRGDFDVLLYLERSNSGRPYVTLSICDLPEGVCRRIYEAAYDAWVYEDLYAEEVERLLELISV
jgi:hypothetical protein